jgi:hypothetical protein
LIEGDIVDLGSASHSKALALMSVRVCGCGTTVLLVCGCGSTVLFALVAIPLARCGGCALLRSPEVRNAGTLVNVETAVESSCVDKTRRFGDSPGDGAITPERVEIRLRATRL